MQAELRRQNVKDVPIAIATADGLVNFKLGPSFSSVGEKKKLRSEGKKSPQKYGKEVKKDKKKKEGESLK